MSSVDPDPSRRFHRGLLVTVFVGALWRIGVLVVDKWQQPLLLNDSIYYSAQARQIVDGIWFREIFVDRPGAEHGPLTSLLLATVSWVDDPVPWQRAVTVVCGIVTIALVGVLARRIAGDVAGVVAAGIAALYPNLWMNDGLVMSESVSVLALVATLLLAHRCLARPAPLAAVLVGAGAGLAALARSELALLTPGLALLLWFAARTPSTTTSPESPPATTGARLVAPVLVLAAAAVTVAPWVTFNLGRFERPVTLTTNDGTTLLGSYCDETFSRENLGGWSLACVVADPDYTQDEDPSMRSERQRGMAVEYAVDHATKLPAVMVARVGRTLDLYGLDSLVAQDVGEERYRWASWAGIISWWALALTAVTGWRRIRASTGRADRWLLLLPCVAVAVTTVVFYGAHRIRSSVEPSVVIAASIVIASWWKRRTHRTRRTHRMGVSTGSDSEPQVSDR